MSVEVGYYRRIWQNFPVIDNVLAAASDFQQFNDDGADRLHGSRAAAAIS